MLERDNKTSRLKKQPAKIGSQIIIHGYAIIGMTENKAYKVVATENSKPENRKSYGHTYPLNNHKGWDKSRFGVFIIDDNGDKRFLRLGTDVFGTTVEVLPNAN